MGAARAAPIDRLAAARSAREGDAEHRDLAAIWRGAEREVRDVKAALVEDRTRREVERVIARILPVARDERAVRRQHLDLVRLIGAHVEVSLDVELDTVGAVERTRAQRGAVREDRDRAGAAVIVHGDLQDAVVRRVRDVEEALCPVKANTVRTERREAMGREQRIRLPDRLAAAGRADGVNGPAHRSAAWHGERVRYVERAAVIARDRIRRPKTGG